MIKDSCNVIGLNTTDHTQAKLVALNPTLS